MGSLDRGKKELLRAVDAFTNLIVVKVSWIYLPPQKIHVQILVCV